MITDIITNHETKPSISTQCAIYLRVSTDKQTVDAQRAACHNYAAAHSLPAPHVIEDTASGALTWKNRLISQLINAARPHTHVIIYDYSRLGRDMFDTLDCVRAATEHGITLHIAKNNTQLNAGIESKILTTVLTLAAEIERDILRSRTKEALAARQRSIDQNGYFVSKTGERRTSLGRPQGPSAQSKLTEHRNDIQRMLNHGVSLRALSRMHHCDVRTIKRLITLPQTNLDSTQPEKK